MKQLILSLFLFFTLTAWSQKPAYVIYNAKGKKVSYNKVMNSLESSDVLLFGELHNNPIAHWLQLEVTTDLHAKRPLILGAEMLEADNQLDLDRYLMDSISYAEYDSLVRLWPNYETDYSPLVEFAKKEQLNFIATNIPRRYARLVHNGGFEALDTLTAQEKEWIAPLPFPYDSELPRYKNILDMMGEHGSPELVKAQASKDATMAHFILKNYQSDHLFIHYNGAYHSDFHEGILWYLKQQEPDLNYTTISTVSQEDLSKLEKDHLNTADFIICVDADMTTTY